MDESKVEGLHYGYTEWGMVSHSWTDTWYLDMLGGCVPLVRGTGVLKHWGIEGGFG